MARRLDKLGKKVPMELKFQTVPQEVRQSKAKAPIYRDVFGLGPGTEFTERGAGKVNNQSE